MSLWFPELNKTLPQIKESLEPFVGPSVFELIELSSRATSAPVPVLQPMGDGCYLAVSTGKTRYNTLEMSLELNLAPWGRQESLVLRGKFTDMRLRGEQYERWYRSPFAHPYIMEISDRVPLMTAYSIRRIELAAQQHLENPGLSILEFVPDAEIEAVRNYFNVPVQLDYLV